MTSELPDSLPEQPRDPNQSPDDVQPEGDYLDEIRQDLKEEAVRDQAKKKTGWLARLTGRLRHEKVSPEPTEPPVTEEPAQEPEAAAEPGPVAELEPVAEPGPVEEPAPVEAVEDELPEEEAPKALAFDIEIEDVEWTPPEEIEAAPIDDDLFSSRLGQFTDGDEPPVLPFEPSAPAPSPFIGADAPDEPQAPFVFDDPVAGEIDFETPLPALDDQDEPVEAPDLSASDSPADEPPTISPFILDEDETPAVFDEAEGEVPAEWAETSEESAAEAGDEAISPAGETEAAPPKPGFFARIFPFRRGNKEDRYTMDDEVVTGRLSLAGTPGEDWPIVPEPGKTPPAETPSPAETTPPAKPAGTRPFWDGISEGPSVDEEYPKTEEEFWDLLANKGQEYDTPFRVQPMNWAAFDEKKSPGHTTPFLGVPDEEWQEESPAAPGPAAIYFDDEAAEETESESPWAADALPAVSPAVSEEESALPDEPLESEEDTAYRETIHPLPDLGDEEAVEIGELRSIVLEDYQEEPAVKESRGRRFARWLGAHRVALLVGGLAICSLIAIGIVAWPLVLQNVAAQSPAATATPDPAALPYPVGLRLTGGWFFNLQKGQLTDGNWDPTSAEWLDGTELRRVVAIPWNRQSEAVIRSLLPGDEMLLHMSNNAVQTYTVRSVEQVNRSERDLLSGNDPSLLIVLVKPESEQRWVVLCSPGRGEVNTD